MINYNLQRNETPKKQLLSGAVKKAIFKQFGTFEKILDLQRK